MKHSNHKNYKSLNFLDPLSNLTSYISQAKRIYNEEIENKKKKRFYFSTSNLNDLENEKNKKINKTNRYPSLNSKLYDLKKSDENFNVMKKIKEIRRIINRSYQSNDPFMKNRLRIPFDSENADVVFTAKNQLANFKQKEANKLINKTGSLYKFYKEKKQTAMDNVVIKLLNNESQKLNFIEEENSKKIDDENKKYITYKNSFDEFSKQQKIAMREIDKSLSNMEDKYRQLLYMKREQRNITNNLNEEMEKKINQIEDLRIYAQFVNNVLNGCKKFDKLILKVDDDFINNNNKIITIEDLVNECIKHYSFLIDPKFNEDNNNVLNLNQDPDNFIDEFHKIENKILKKLEIYESKEKEKQKIKEERKDILNELQNQLKFYEKEFDVYNENLNKVIEDYSKISSSKINNNAEIIEIIKEFHLDYCSKDINIIGLRVSTLKQKNMQIEDIIKEIITKIKTEERKVNILISTLENYEMQDPNTFIPIIVQRKKDNKLFKQISSKNKIDEELEAKNLASQQKFEKIIIQYRKSLPPPFRIAKKKIKENIDAGKNKENKDLDLIFY